jgi:hypothetical protein
LLADDTVLADDTPLTALPTTDRPNVAAIEPAAAETLEAGSPLQAVWPVQMVQRTDAPAFTPPSTAPVSPAASLFPTPTELPVRPPTPQDFWVEERLATVPPGMPTDSSVPLLRPRRPRPERPSTSTASVIDTPSLIAETGGTAVPPVSTIQRQPESESGTVGLVPTEIGALPPDLWTLIGQPLPTMAVQETQPPAGQPVVMAKREGDGVSPMPDSPIASAPDLSDYIQLEGGGEGGAATTAVPGADGAGGEETEEKKEGEKVDINELARQVYAQLRGQLMIERERERGRLTHTW